MFFEEWNEPGRLFFCETFLQLGDDINRAGINSSQHRKITTGEITQTHEVHHFRKLTFPFRGDLKDMCCGVMEQVTHEIKSGRHIDGFFVLIAK